MKKIISNIILIMIFLSLTGCATQKLYAINEQINKVPYVAPTDKKVKKPRDFVVTGGNCRDYVEAKYQAALAAGIPDEDMKIVLTSWNEQPHLVLQVGNYVLDNNYQSLRPANSVQGVRMTHEYWMKVVALMK